MWFVLAGCQEPFDTDRHDLVGFRLAAVEAPAVASGAPFVARAAVIVDGRAWAETPAALSWSFVPDEDAALGPLTPVATGADPVLRAPADARTLVVEAVHGSAVARAFLTLASPPATLAAPTGLAAGTVDLPAIPVGPELARDARAALVPGEGRAVDPRGWLRLRVTGTDARTRFMATAGTFLELDATTTDWAASDGLVLDEDELDAPGTPTPEGVVTGIALSLTGGGETAFLATEWFVGDAPEGTWLGARFVPSVGLPPVPEGLGVRTTLREDPDAPSGFRLEGGAAVSPALVSDFGTPALPCDPLVDGPLDPDWFLTQRCTPTGADGLEVVVVPSPPPPVVTP